VFYRELERETERERTRASEWEGRKASEGEGRKAIGRGVDSVLGVGGGGGGDNGGRGRVGAEGGDMEAEAARGEAAYVERLLRASRSANALA
jgi:hypothetical protein